MALIAPSKVSLNSITSEPVASAPLSPSSRLTMTRITPAPAAMASSKAAAAKNDESFEVKPQETRLTKMADSMMLGYIAKQRASSLAAPASQAKPHYVILFDFDHTLSTEDSGEKLAREHNIAKPTKIFERMAKADASVRPGGELASALARAPEFQSITRQDLVEAGRGVGLKDNVGHVFKTLSSPNDAYKLSMFVLSAGPTETIRTALDGVVPAEQVQGTRMNFTANNEKSIQHVTAGQGKADFIDALLTKLGIPASHLMFAGDGSSDEVAFRYSRERGGFNILVKQNPKLLPLSHAQVYGDDLGGVVNVVRDHLASREG